MVDEKYAETAQDTKIGETISLLGSEIERFARTCLSVVQLVEAGLPELHPKS